MSGRGARSLSLAWLAVLGVACSSPGLAASARIRPGIDAPATSGPVGTLRWGTCDRYSDDFTLTDLAGFDRAGIECATLSVPLDHAEPDGATIDLAVARLSAQDPTRRWPRTPAPP